MPQISASFSPTGPLLDVFIGVSFHRHEALKKAGVPTIAPVPARLLVDTGASCSAIDETVLQKLSLTPTGYCGVHTPSTDGTPKSTPQYDVGIILPHVSQQHRFFSALPVFGGNFRAQGIDGLLGRDVLAHCLFVMSGPDGAFTIAF